MELTNELRREAATFVSGRFDRAFKFWDETYYQRMRDWDDYYYVKLPSDLDQMLRDDERSSLVPPDIHFLTNDFRASLVIPFMRAGTIAKVKGIGPSDVDNEQAIQMMLDWNLRTSKFWFEFDKDCQNIALGGYAVGILNEEPVNFFGVKNGKIVEEELFDGARFPMYKHLDRFKVYPDPRALRLVWPECRYVVYQEYMSREQLLHLKAKDPDIWDFDSDDLKKARGERTRDEKAVNDARGNDYRVEVEIDDTEPIPVTHYYGEWIHDNDTDNIQQAIISIAGKEPDSQAVLRFWQPDMKRNYVDMFQMATLNPTDDRLLSMGKVEAIEDTFLELYTKKNQRVDAVNVNAWGVNFIGRDSNVPEAHRLGPMTFIQVDDPQSVNTYAGGDTSALFAEAAALQGELRTVYGSDYSLGVNPGQRESATGANILVEAQSARTVMSVHHLWNSGWERQTAFRLAMLQEGAPDEIWMRLTEDPTIPLTKVTREQIQGKFDMALSVGVDDFTPDAIRRAQFERIAAFYRDDPDIDQIRMKKRHLVMNGFADANFLVPKPEEREALPRKESLMMLKFGTPFPIDPGEDHLLHYEVHMKTLLAATKLAQEGKVLGRNMEVLQDHAEQHLGMAEGQHGVQTNDRSVIPRGNGKVPQPSTNLGPGDQADRIGLTRSKAQVNARARTPFQ